MNSINPTSDKGTRFDTEKFHAGRAERASLDTRCCSLIGTERCLDIELASDKARDEFVFRLCVLIRFFKGKMASSRDMGTDV